MRIHPSLSLLLLLAPAIVSAHGPGPNVPVPSIASLMTRALPEYPGKEVLMLEVEYPPGGADPVHRHDAHAFVYVLEGSIVMGVAGGEEVTLTAGQTFHEAPGDVHTVGRNASRDKPARFVVVLLKDADKPALIPVP